MKKRTNIKKRRRLILMLGFLVVLGCVCFFFLKKGNYTKHYTRDGYDIFETYHKNKDYYKFLLKKDEEEFLTVVYNQHFSSKKIISQVERYQTENEVCIKLNSSKARFFPLCLSHNQQISYHLASLEMKNLLQLEEEETKDNVLDTYQNIHIYQYLNADYYVWNYRGFYRINEKRKEEIKLFSKDIYHPSFIMQVNDTLVVPDYEADYYFNKVYLIHMKSGKVETWDLKENIYFDSIVLGVKDGDIYFVDKHEKIEWKMNPFKKKLERVGTEAKGGIIFQNGWQDISMNKLLYQTAFFQGVNIYDYEIQNDGLYAVIGDKKIRIRNEAPTKIVSSNDGFVYYLVQNKLYAYSESTKEVLLLDYFEWNFNSDNVIFIAN